MKTANRILTSIAVVAAVTASVATVSPVGEALAQERWSIATSSTGSSPYMTGSNIATVLNRLQDKLLLSAQTSGGFKENLALVGAGKVNLAMSTTMHADFAYTGRGKFGKLPGNEMFRSIRLLFPVTLDTLHIAVLANSGIKSLQDLKGRKVNLNVPATATRSINKRVFAAANIDLKDFKVFGIATKGSFDALRDGVIDATSNILPKGAGILQQLAATKPVDLVPIPNDVFDRLNKMFAGTLARSIVKANTYPGQTADVPSFSIPAVLITNEKSDPDLVYAFVRAYWENIGELVKFDRTLGDVSIELAASAVSKAATPLHPGAARYFREKGLLP